MNLFSMVSTGLLGRELCVWAQRSAGNGKEAGTGNERCALIFNFDCLLFGIRAISVEDTSVSF